MRELSPALILEGVAWKELIRGLRRSSGRTTGNIMNTTPRIAARNRTRGFNLGILISLTSIPPPRTAVLTSITPAPAKIHSCLFKTLYSIQLEAATAQQAVDHGDDQSGGGFDRHQVELFAPDAFVQTVG